MTHYRADVIFESDMDEGFFAEWLEGELLGAQSGATEVIDLSVYEIAWPG